DQPGRCHRILHASDFGAFPACGTAGAGAAADHEPLAPGVGERPPGKRVASGSNAVVGTEPRTFRGRRCKPRRGSVDSSPPYCADLAAGAGLAAGSPWPGIDQRMLAPASPPMKV